MYTGKVFWCGWQVFEREARLKVPLHATHRRRLLVPLCPNGSVEKIRQRRSRHFSVLTYSAYAPRVKMAAALLDGPFGKTQACFFEPTCSL